KVVHAIERAAAVMRGEKVPPYEPLQRAIPAPPELFGGVWDSGEDADGGGDVQTRTRTAPAIVVTPPEVQANKVVGKPEPKVDAVKLAAGKPVYTDDIEMPGMLHAAMLTSPHAHARIRDIDTSEAERLPGVRAVL